MHNVQAKRGTVVEEISIIKKEPSNFFIGIKSKISEGISDIKKMLPILGSRT